MYLIEVHSACEGAALAEPRETVEAEGFYHAWRLLIRRHGGRKALNGLLLVNRAKGEARLVSGESGLHEARLCESCKNAWIWSDLGATQCTPCFQKEAANARQSLPLSLALNCLHLRQSQSERWSELR